MRTGLDIAVAGAGPGGLATALFLNRDGHRVTLFERFDAPRPVGSGLLLQPTGLAVLGELGLEGAITALGQPVERLEGTDARTGRVVLDVRYARLPHLGCGLGVHRAALFDVLHNAVVAAGVPIRTGFTVTGMTGGAGSARLASAGPSEGPFDLVVDTLGSGSPLRGLARAGDVTRQLAYGALWATTPWADGFDRRTLTQRYRRASVMIGVLPIGRQRLGGPELAAFFWSLRADAVEQTRATGLDAWKETVRGHWPETAPHLDAIENLNDLALARYAHHTLRVPAGDGIVFVGDSAHSTSPQLGQGANMALLDACALAMALRTAPDITAALEMYARLRRWQVRLYQFLSLTLTPLYQSDSRVLPAIRDFLNAIVGRVPPAPQLLAMMVAGQLFSPLRPLGLDIPRQARLSEFA